MMKKRITISTQTRNNWLIDVAVFGGGLFAALSGIYFLYVPSGGYRGGRNVLNEVLIIFDRSSWDTLHTWTGVFMILAAVLHFTFHWQWVLTMSKRIMTMLRPGGTNMSSGAKLNLVIFLLVALSFTTTAVSGIYFLFAPVGGYQGGRNLAWDPGLIFSRTTWDLIHTWSGVILILAAVVHFSIHWRWVVKVTRHMLESFGLRFRPRQGQEKMLI
ncbi:MAG TPA: DUF4405 domain-containing protein [Anaerolineae bacterium]|nr:MAG: hypothetical protein AMJ88_17250 [Anaerolineae bacterium SM23_ 63]HEY43403.1 DUF4405 domain-containing protein [Anaerolineae bacterium]